MQMPGHSTLGALTLGPLEFGEPVWLVLIPVLVAITLLLSRRSLAGLGVQGKYVAVGVRVIVITLLTFAVAEPSFRRESKDVAVTVVLDTSKSIPGKKQSEVDKYIENARAANRRPDDLLGVVTAAKDAYVQSLPSRLTREVEQQTIGATDGTNLAAAVRLALATMPKDAANRVVLATDGNETVGSLLQAAETAKALKVPIDVYPIRYRYEGEVLVDKLVAPASAREGETVNLRAVLQAVKAARGRLTILMNGEAVDLDPDPALVGTLVDLKEGLNVIEVPITALRGGPQKFEAIFEPETQGGVVIGDSIAENNRSLAVTFVSGQGKVLVLAEKPEFADQLLKALDDSKVRVEVKPASQCPTTVTDLNAYDAIVMVDQSAYEYSQQTQEALRQYVHDTGGGLLMVGGPNSFGAGGWIGSPLEDALPIKLDPPQKRQMPRGALALVIHSCEIPEGVFFGKKVCEAAVNSLSRLDLVGINEYDWGTGTRWVHPIQQVGDGTAVKRSIQNLTFGDMPDFTPSLELAFEGLSKAEAGQRHVIMISDGDPSSPSTALLDKFIQNKITVSTVGVFPHSGGDTSRMQWISKYTGGRHYEVLTQGALATLPQIFIKEAQTIRRSLIWEGTPFVPAMVPSTASTMRGVTSVPAIRGYVVAAEREGLSQTMLRGKENDPIMAQWQYGLGRVITYTSDANTRWNPEWVAWSNYKNFWEQQARYVMRPSGSANLRVVTENKGDQTIVTVEAIDSAGERLNFANFKGRLAMPDGTGFDVDLKQDGPGRYRGVVPSDQSGSYVLSLRYAAPDPKVEGGVLEGSVQAAISRPFADEYRTLEDNAPLLTQVAEMTGGRVLEGNPELDDVWSRKGLELPVARRSIWLWCTLLGLGLFLADVGVRRVRIDPAAIRDTIAGAFRRKAAAQAGQQIGGLKVAREQAKQKIAERAAASGRVMSASELEAAAKQAVKDAGTQAKDTASRKFEASAEQLKQASQGKIAMGGADARPEKIVDKARPVDGGGEDGMNRLLKAKKKAQEDMQDEG